jgi:hypothetical protein
MWLVLKYGIFVMVSILLIYITKKIKQQQHQKQQHYIKTATYKTKEYN